MHAIVNIVLFGDLAFKANLDSFQSPALTSRAGKAVLPRLPADVLDVPTKLNIALVTIPINLGRKRFHLQASSRRSGGLPVFDTSLPANPRDMRVIGYRRRLVLAIAKRRCGVSRRGRTLFKDENLDCLNATTVAGRTSLPAVTSPIKPKLAE